MQPGLCTPYQQPKLMMCWLLAQFTIVELCLNVSTNNGKITSDFTNYFSGIYLKKKTAANDYSRFKNKLF
jgi:hypothetical protein